ncbi:hypothetical protein BDV96DRAFT_590169 [Lophiotrema nucula]|uniref:F-box domain-containing protein n=1 Tax=Lophiotrema nucula TaxID=690887 RepID=A0A6A5YIU4_9PLEO|nr:hypothetical protein BDV96DRAFT_590169 [Lophiotrema nucula]
MASFNTLPVELTLNVMHYIASPTDLFNLLCTSGSICGIFRDYKISTLTAVIHNAVPPDAMIDFLRAHQAYDACSLIAKRQYYSAITEENWEYPQDYYDYVNPRLQRVREHLQTPMPSLDFPNLGTLASLARFWRLVDGFVVDFLPRWELELRERTKLFKSLLIHREMSHRACSTPLTREEYARLFLAFCRFEEYRRLFGGMLHDYPDSSSYLVKEEFTNRYSPWELLELLGVWRYLRSKAEDAIKDHMSTVLSTFHALDPLEMDLTSDSVDHERAQDIYNILGLDPESPIRYLIDGMPELGLPFLRSFCGMSFQERLTAMKLVNSIHSEVTLPQHIEFVLDPFPPRSLGTTYQGPPINKLYPHVFLGSNPPPVHLDSVSLCGEIGLVFWEQQRLETLSDQFLELDFTSASRINVVSEIRNLMSDKAMAKSDQIPSMLTCKEKLFLMWKKFPPSAELLGCEIQSELRLPQECIDDYLDSLEY